GGGCGLLQAGEPAAGLEKRFSCAGKGAPAAVGPSGPHGQPRRHRPGIGRRRGCPSLVQCAETNVTAKACAYNKPEGTLITSLRGLVQATSPKQSLLDTGPLIRW